MKEILQKLNARTDLTESEAQRAFDAIMDGNVAPDLIAEFLLALSKKGLSVDEVTAAARAMRARSMKIDVGSMDVLDTCGTGGDVKGTFNISTAA
ncbi:MAG TPA: hypothetical protein PK402_07510, partial [Tepidisphaeraceae bacterium]|nr:hypothetical protein [Tepidisphaeraceae bacterium]